jgi:hypothetical protein
VLGWTPDTFWASTPVELIDAIKGRTPQAAVEPMTHDEAQALYEEYG